MAKSSCLRYYQSLTKNTEHKNEKFKKGGYDFSNVKQKTLYAVKNVDIERRARGAFTVHYVIHTGRNQNTYHLFPNKVAETITQKGVFRSSWIT